VGIVVGVVAAAAILGGASLFLAKRSHPTATALSPTAPVVTPAPSPSVIPPVNVTTSVEAFKVTLTWTQVTGGTAVDTYHVYRDGALLGDVAAPTTSYTDTTVVPGKSYTYEIDSSGGGVVSSKIPVEVKTPVPSLSQGRVEGTFNVSLTAVSHSGFSSFNSKFTLGWHFAPKCNTGVCNVVWTDLSEKTIKATLKRSGTKYSGSDSALFNVQCNGTIVTSNLTVSFHVSKAKAIDGAWRASTLVGTFTESNPSQLGCLTSSATYSFTATFVS